MRNPYWYYVPNNYYRRPNNMPQYTNPYNNNRYTSPYEYNKQQNEEFLRPCIIEEKYCDYFDLGDKAPDFTLKGIVSGQPKDVSLSDYLGQWVVLFFYGSDFTFV